MHLLEDLADISNWTADTQFSPWYSFCVRPDIDFSLLTNVEKYWDNQPCNLNHSKKPIGSKDYFIEVSNRRYFVEGHIEEFAGFAQMSGKNVLEIGCGIGTDAARFAEKGANFFGTELSEKSLAIARERFHVFGLRGSFAKVSAEELDLCELGWPAPDLIYSFGVLHHTVNPDLALANIARQVPSGTEFRIMLYARHSWKSAMIAAGLDQPEAQADCPIALTYTLEGVERLLSNASLETVSIRQDHIFPFKIPEYRNFQYVLEPWFECMPDEVFQALKRSLGWHLLVTAKKK